MRIEGDYATAPNGLARTLVHRVPVGVAALVTPWNFPAAMPARKIAPALAAGCSVVLKPAAETPLSALALVELMVDAGLPAGVVNVVPTLDAAGVVDAWLRDSRVRKLSFTGSTPVGRTLLRAAAGRVVNCFDGARWRGSLRGTSLRRRRQGRPGRHECEVPRRRSGLHSSQQLPRAQRRGRGVHTEVRRCDASSPGRSRSRRGDQGRAAGEREDPRQGRPASPVGARCGRRPGRRRGSQDQGRVLLHPNGTGRRPTGRSYPDPGDLRTRRSGGRVRRHQ